jgi:hypothetical protein
VFGYYCPGSPSASPSHPGSDFRGYHQAQIADDRFAVRLGTAVAAATSPGSVVVGLGMDWSSELPFYADRRALMLPDWLPRHLDSPMLAGSLGNLRSGEVGALVVCSPRAEDAAFSSVLAERLRLDPVPTRTAGCWLFTPGRYVGSPPP